MLAVADWWLAMTGAVLGVTAAAAAPATTTDRAKIRMASFIVGNLCGFRLTGEYVFCIEKWYDLNQIKSS
jgi:hypothetical protein